MLPYGKCQCATGIRSLGCCGGTGPAAYQSVRDGMPIRTCTHCDLSSDRARKVLVKATDDFALFATYDALGALVLAGRVAEAEEAEAV